MNNYISLIQLTAPLNADGVRKLSRHACLDIHRVQWLRSCLDESGLRMLNWYQAQDAESVRLVLRQQGSPEAAVWPVDVFGDPTDEALSEPGSRVIFEWHPPVPDQFHTSGPLSFEGFRIRLFKPRCEAPVIGVMPAVEAPGLQRQLIAAGFEPSASWLCLELDPRPRQLFEPESPAMLRQDQQSAAKADRRTGGQAQLDAVIIGAGISGICMLQRLERMGLRSRVFESGGDIGGVWHWNRYPGARVDSEVYTYGFSFSDELLDHWHWSEMFAGQAEILDYLRYVVDRWSLRQHMQFNTRVVAATFDAEGGFWRIRTDKGEIITAQFLIAATGSLTTPQMPDYPGMSLFAGESYHTARWPECPVALKDRRVGVIGTGASGVQVIQSIAGQVGQLVVFQRTPTYCIPQRNRLLSADDRQQIRRDWATIMEACKKSYGGFIHTFDTRSGLAVTAAEREAKFEALWRTPGFAFWFGNFADLMMNDEVNAHASEFLCRKIRERVHDPETVSKMLPDHPFGSKRVPLENGYYEVFNRSNVHLVDLRKTPIKRITAAGIETDATDYPLDLVIYATGFDAGTGALNRIDIRGPEGFALADKWRDGARTFLGLLVAGFPNLFILNGPHNAAALCNAGRCIEQNVDWVARCMEQLRQQGLSRVEPTLRAEQEWTEHVYETADATVLAKMTNSWFFGANTPGKPRRVTIYAGGASEYREHCEAVAASGYAGLVAS